jgi:hypothetical protein
MILKEQHCQISNHILLIRHIGCLHGKLKTAAVGMEYVVPTHSML